MRFAAIARWNLEEEVVGYRTDARPIIGRIRDASVCSQLGIEFNHGLPAQRHMQRLPKGELCRRPSAVFFPKCRNQSRPRRFLIRWGILEERIHVRLQLTCGRYATR